MKRLLIKCTAVMLVAALLFTSSTGALAAPSRNTGGVKYLSEVALIEAKDLAEAEKLLAELKKAENGGFEAMIEMDLNEGGKSVYLVYKSSTNVDDAITDLAVMDMNGEFSMGSYEHLYEQTVSGYDTITRDYREMAAEFKKNYDAGYPNAVTAHRQMNYYYLERGDSKIYMGDYMLNFPASDDEFSMLLFEGNLKVISNLRSLMAMGVGDREELLADRITAAFAAAQADPGLYLNASYEDAAKNILTRLTEMKNSINTVPGEIAEIEKLTIDPEFSEDMLTAKQHELDSANSFYELLCDIGMGQTTLGEYVMNTPIIDYATLYPILGAATRGEALLMEYGSFYELLLYDELSLGGAALDEALTELEKEYEPISVYHGVQNDLKDGTVGVTGDADLLSASTGTHYLDGESGSGTVALEVASYVIGFAGIASMVGGIAYLAVKKSAATTAYAALQQSLAKSQALVMKNIGGLARTFQAYNNFATKYGSDYHMAKVFADDVPMHWNGYIRCDAEVDKAMAALNKANPGLTGTQIAAGTVLIALGVAMMAVSIGSLVNIYSSFTPKYTDIPDNMVNVVYHEDLGDRFINYQNVTAYYYKNGKLATRENDLNAYDGRAWVSLYYTKSYEAGKCLTTSADLIAEESARTGYSPIHLFGRSSNYNLNSHCNRENAKPIYLSFKYSTNKKSADTAVPDLIGSAFALGGCAISAFAGIGLGMGLMAFIKRKYKED